MLHVILGPFSHGGCTKIYGSGPGVRVRVAPQKMHTAVKMAKLVNVSNFEWGAFAC